jgi:hypothetical protein
VRVTKSIHRPLICWPNGLRHSRPSFSIELLFSGHSTAFHRKTYRNNQVTPNQAILSWFNSETSTYGWDTTSSGLTGVFCVAALVIRLILELLRFLGLCSCTSNCLNDSATEGNFVKVRWVVQYDQTILFSICILKQHQYLEKSLNGFWTPG